MEGRIRIVVGLGNPGDEHLGTRHNAGFEILDSLARALGLLFESTDVLPGYAGSRRALIAVHSSRDVILLKPVTYMNLSGEAVGPIFRWAAMAHEDMLVVHDDIDLPLGTLRIRPHGGAGGHNGVRSIMECLGTDLFPRLRVGIGRPRTDAARHVLEPFERGEREEMDVTVAEATEALLFWLSGKTIDDCMTRFHSRWNQASH